jgi:uncharacterized coiled-coil DUF342 family protein
MSRATKRDRIIEGCDEYDAEIEDLQQELKSLHNTCASLKDELDGALGQIKDLEAELQAKETA